MILSACDTWKEPFRPKDPNWRTLAVARTPLPDTAFRVRWNSSTIPGEMSRRAEADVRISFTNLGDAVWPDVLSGDPQKRDGSYAVRLAYDWTNDSIDPARKPGPRVELPHSVHPGETMTLLVHLVAPEEPGPYRLSFELLQELVAWFGAKGAPKLVVPVIVK